MKNRIIFGFVLAVLTAGQSFSQTYLVQVKPAGGKVWGYANPQGDLVIPAKFELCYPFSSDGLAPIYDKKEKQYYFINVKGDKLATEISDYRLISPPFGMTDVVGFDGGMVPVKIGDMWGYMNKAGKLVVKAKYEHVSEFNGSYAIASNGDTFYVVDANGQETKVDAANAVDIKHFSENLAPFRTADKKVGFIDVHGKVVIPPQFESVGYFVNRLAWAKNAEGILGYINTKGEWVIKPQFQAGKEFDAESGLARIKTGDHWAYVTTSGQIVNINDTETWGDFSEGLSEGKKGDLRGFYNKDGTWVIKPQYEGVRDFMNGYAAVKQGGKWGMIDKKGNWAIKPMFDGIRDMQLIR